MHAGCHAWFGLNVQAVAECMSFKRNHSPLIADGNLGGLDGGLILKAWTLCHAGPGIM